MHIQEKTLTDIEFHTVLSQMSAHCVTHLGNEKALQTVPFSDKEALLTALLLTNDYLASFDNDNRIPNHGFEPITREIQLLKI
jgi:DNA mismatch repair protein MutS2